MYLHLVSGEIIYMDSSVKCIQIIAIYDCVHSKEFELEEEKLMELLKVYDIKILYHLVKVVVVVDALNRKAVCMGCFAYLQICRRPWAREVHNLSNDFMRLEILEKAGFLVFSEARSFFLDKI